MRRDVRLRIVSLLTAALASAMVVPPAHASGGPGGSNSDSCHPVVGGQAGATTPVPVAENATVNCPYATGPTGQPAGPPGNVPGPVLQPGQNCSYGLYRPIKWVATAAGALAEVDPSLDGNSYATPNTYPTDLQPVAVDAATKTWTYLPVVFTGKADANGQCTVPNPGWQIGCPQLQPWTNFVVAGNVCWYQDTGHPAVGGGMTPPQLVPYLDQAALVQLINVGRTLSLPPQPHPGLVNTGTCFLIRGANYQAPGGGRQPIQQPATYEMHVSQPVGDGSGRFIFYVFRITLTLTAQWDFGDGTSTPDQDTPQACNQLAQPRDIVISHTYHSYGTFQVYFHEHFDVVVNEYWDDATGTHGPVLVPGVVPPILRDIGPFAEQVVQEEGVPVGGA